MSNEVTDFPIDVNEILVRYVIDDLILRPLRISGVEVTQAIQYYQARRHLTDPADRGPDNSVQLVALKPAWVRVYIRGFFQNILNVSGIIELQKREFGIIYQTQTTLSPQPPGHIVAQLIPNYAAERGNIGTTLNFIIPAQYMCGNLRLKVRISSGSFSHNRDVDLNVTLCQTLRLAGIMIGYNGSNGAPTNPTNITLPMPTLQDLQDTAPFTLTTMPVQSTATFRLAGSFVWNTPLTDPPSCSGCCTPNWISLNNRIQQERVNDGNRTDVIYYGLMAAGIPMGPIIGCNSVGVSSGEEGNQIVMAHEIGHYLGLSHAPCGVTGDPNYPAYEPYDPANTPMASIGEYGLNINNGNILNPQTYKDYMSYCGPGWISLYHYGKLINNPLLDPVRVCIDEPGFNEYAIDPNRFPRKWLPDPPPIPVINRRIEVNPTPLISIIGVVKSDNEIEVRSVTRLEAFRNIPGAKPTEFTAELIDKSERVIASAPVYRLPSHSIANCGCDNNLGDDSDPAALPPYLFQVFLDNTGRGETLRIRHGKDNIWIRRASAAPPKVNKFSAQVRKEGIIHVNWDIESKSELEPDIWLQWSSDNKKSWNGLTVGLRGKETELDVRALPSGRNLLRLLANDGFFTTISNTITVRIPTRSPSIGILSPREDSEVTANSTLRLWATAMTSSGKPINSSSVQWFIDGKEIARGLDNFVTSPPKGRHSCKVTVDADGKKTERTIKFTTRSTPFDDK
jgi:hypothetical protein